jgi:hypothetical protein
MPTIFINFRNGDGDWAAKLIRDTLAGRLGEENIFLSSDSIPLGTQYPDTLTEKARTCDALLALVGPDWLTIAGADGRPRLFADGDWVRREIATALAAGRRVAAIRLDDAPRLRPDDLPPDIRELADRQDARINRRQFDHDIAGLEQALMEIIPGLTAKSRPGRVKVSGKFDIGKGRNWHVHGADIAESDRDVEVDIDMRMEEGEDIEVVELKERQRGKGDRG